MKNIYYTDLFVINDEHRKEKYKNLLITSLKNDLSNWSEILNSDGDVFYRSPLYNESRFIISKYGSIDIAYVTHKNSVVNGENVKSELISNYFDGELKTCFINLKNKIFTPEIYEIEKSIGNIKNERKEKLQLLEIEQIKDLVEDTYSDWLSNESEISAKFIAKIIYSYRNKENTYDLWMEKFGDIKIIIDYIKKMENGNI